MGANLSSPELSPGRIPAIAGFGQKGLAIGAFLVVMLVQLVIFLTAIVNPGILPGNWTPLIPVMEFYFFTAFLALFLFGYSKRSFPGGDVQTFLLRFSIFAGLTWLAMTFLFLTSPVAAPLTGGTKLQYLLFVGFFIAPVEEVFFRVALPPYTGWFIGSVVMFAVYHIPAYLLQFNGASTVAILSNIVYVAMMGALLWFVYRRWGLGASIGVHFLYDVFVFGAIVGLPLSLGGLGLTPI